MIPAVLTLTAFIGGCTGRVYVPIDVADIERGGEDWIGEQLQVHTTTAVSHISVTEVSYPWLIGFDYKSGYEPPLKIDLREVTRIERYSASATTRRAMTRRVIPITIALAFFVWIQVSQSDS